MENATSRRAGSKYREGSPEFKETRKGNGMMVGGMRIPTGGHPSGGRKRVARIVEKRNIGPSETP